MMVVAAVSIVGLVVGNGPSGAQSDDGQATVDDAELYPAILNLEECVNEVRRLDVMVVIDESASLRGPDGTDPAGRRVDGTLAAIEALIGLTRERGGQPGLEVGLMIAGFASEFAVRTGDLGPDGFVPLSEATREVVYEVAESFRERNDGDWTNFEAALEGAVIAFSARSASMTADGGPSPCKAMLLVTDGDLDLASRDEEVAAQDQICRAEGLADETRVSDITLLTVALFRPEDFEDSRDPLLPQRIAIGEDDNGVVCGTTGSEETGLYVRVTNAEDLARQLGRIFDPEPPPPPTTVPPSTQPPPPPPPGSTMCSSEELCGDTFTIPSLASGFRVSAIVPETDAAFQLATPNGDTLVLGDSTLDGTALGESVASLRRVSAGGVTGDVTVGQGDAGQWTWTVTYPDGSEVDERPSVTIALVSELEPVVVGSPTLVAGRSTEVELQVFDRGGPIDAPPGSTLAARVSDPVDGTERDLTVERVEGTDRWRTSIDVPDDATATEWSMTMVAEIESDGIALPVAVANVVLPIEVPGGIVIEPPELRLPSIVDTGSVRTTVTATATGDEGGCVWIVPGDIDGARDDATITYRSTADDQSTCQRVDSGETIELPITFDADAASRGTAKGTVVVTVDHDDPEIGTRGYVLPASLEQAVSPRWAWRWVAIGTAVALFVVITLAVLHLMSWRGARFARPNHLSYWEGDVLLSNNGLRSADETQSLDALGDDDFRLVGPSDDRPRRLDVADFELLARPTSLRRPHLRAMFDGSFAEIRVGRPCAVVAGTRSHMRLTADRRRGTHQVPLSLRDTWVFATPGRPRDNGDVSGRLLLILSAAERTPRSVSDLVIDAGITVQRRRGVLGPPEKHHTQRTGRSWFAGLRGRSRRQADDGLDDLPEYRSPAEREQR